MQRVVQRGTDSSGRPVRATDAFWAVWDACCDELGFVPTIVQGGHMGSAGASASAGTHAGDAADIRLWDRTATERARMIRVFRAHAFAYWERYESQGFDPHAHLVPGPWASPAPQALDQWNDYLAGRNGLASNGADYHARPNPIVTTPPEDEMNPAQDERLKDIQAAVARLEAATVAEAARDREETKRDRASWRREAALAREVKRLGGDVDKVLAEVTDEP